MFLKTTQWNKVFVTWKQDRKPYWPFHFKNVSKKHAHVYILTDTHITDLKETHQNVDSGWFWVEDLTLGNLFILYISQFFPKNT